MNNLVKNPVAMVPSSLRNQVFRIDSDIIDIGDIVAPFCVKTIADIVLLSDALKDFSLSESLAVCHLSLLVNEDNQKTLFIFLKYFEENLVKKFGTHILHLEVRILVDINQMFLNNWLGKILSYCCSLRSLSLSLRTSDVQDDTMFEGTACSWNDLPKLEHLQALDLDFDGNQQDLYSRIYKTYGMQILTLGVSLNLLQHDFLDLCDLERVEEMYLQNIKNVTVLHDVFERFNRLNTQKLFKKIVFVCKYPISTFDLLYSTRNLNVEKIEILQSSLNTDLFPEDPNETYLDFQICSVTSLKVEDHSGYKYYKFISWFPNLQKLEICCPEIRRNGKSITFRSIMYALLGNTPSKDFWQLYINLEVLIVSVFGGNRLVYTRPFILFKKDISLASQCNDVAICTSDGQTLRTSFSVAALVPKICKHLIDREDKSPYVNIWVHSNVMSKVLRWLGQESVAVSYNYCFLNHVNILG